MPKLQKPKAKVDSKELAKKLAVETVEEATVTPAKRMGRPKKAQAVETPAPVEEAVVETKPTKGKVSSLADKQKAKAVTPTPTPTPAKAKEEQKQVKPPAKATKTVPVAPVVDEVEDEEVADSWEELFDEVMEGKNYRYTRAENLTIADLKKHLPRQDVHMLIAEPREDGKFTNMVMCFVSTETVTFIDQTGDEDFDSIIQVSHDELIGQKLFKVKRRNKTLEFPFSLYIKEKK